MTDDARLESGTQHSLEGEANALVDRFNSAAPSHSPDLEWFAMSYGRDADEDEFVLEAQGYIDSDGLAALRECGRTITYIEAYGYDDDCVVTIHVPVRGSLPEPEVDARV